MLRKSLFVITVFAFAISAYGDPVDLTSWSPLTLDFPGAQPAGNWVLGGGNTYVDQVVNADPSFYLNNLNQTSYSMDGSWQVRTANDDDYMGFAFGYQNSSNFYLFDWKQYDQSLSGYGSASAGMTIRKMDGPGSDGLVDLSIPEFWQNTVNSTDVTILAANHGSSLGWADNTLYDFHLDFNLTPGEIHIVVKQDATTLWDHTLYDSTFSSGQFGFYNFSQQNVRYAGFEQTGGVIVPVPGAFILGSLGLGLACAKLRKRKELLS